MDYAIINKNFEQAAKLAMGTAQDAFAKMMPPRPFRQPLNQQEQRARFLTATPEQLEVLRRKHGHRQFRGYCHAMARIARDLRELEEK